MHLNCKTVIELCCIISYWLEKSNSKNMLECANCFHFVSTERIDIVLLEIASIVYIYFPSWTHIENKWYWTVILVRMLFPLFLIIPIITVLACNKIQALQTTLSLSTAFQINPFQFQQYPCRQHISLIMVFNFVSESISAVKGRFNFQWRIPMQLLIY